ncbi:MAG: hypothetical protein ACREDU_10125, partial [Methylocella sp.]
MPIADMHSELLRFLVVWRDFFQKRPRFEKLTSFLQLGGQLNELGGRLIADRALSCPTTPPKS